MTQTNKKFKLFEIVESLSYSMDLISETLVGHHKRVAYISLQIGKSMDLSVKDIRKLVIAALIHDLGVFYLNQNLSDLSFDSEDNQHAEIGYRLLYGMFPLEDVATIIRYHHQNWDVSKNTSSNLNSHILHLADKIAVLIEGNTRILNHRQDITTTIRKHSGTYFHPGTVNHFLNVSNKEYFWLDAVSNKIIEQNLSSFFVAHCKNNIGYAEVLNIGRIISHIIDFRSSFTATHSDGVSAIATHLCKYFDFNKNQQTEMQISGYLHDIGKLVVPPHILNKTGELSEQEWNLMKTHTYHTYQALSTSNALDTIKQWASYHHEKLNGEGYPFHLGKKDLSTGSKILAVADVFTAITEDRPYRTGMSYDTSRELIKHLGKAQELDQEVIEIVLDNFSEIYTLRKDSQAAALDYYNDFKEKIKTNLEPGLSV